jgi:hypothetical protein
MEAKFLRKIILEELKKVLKEVDYPDIPGSEPGQAYTPNRLPTGMSMGKPSSKLPSSKPAGDPKIKKLQNILLSAGYDVGKIDGIAGPLFFKAVSDANRDISGVGISPERVAKDFKASGSSAADNFLTMFSDPVQIASLRKANVKKAVDKVTAPLDALAKKSPSITATPPEVNSAPTTPGSSSLPKSPADVKVPFTDKETMDKMIGPRKSFTRPDINQEALVRAISKLLKTL